jgi:hypothetical protein
MMADQLYLSYRLRGFTPQNMVRHYEKLLRLFPYSRLARGASVLRINAVSAVEPPLFERPLEPPVDVDSVMESVREYTAPDCGVFLDTRWDLWQYENDWALAPAPVTLACFGPEFDSGTEDDLRIEFGIDTHFLPQHDLPNNLFMARSNVRSLLHLVHELDRTYTADSRKLWTESGENFSERLRAALGDEAS